VWFVKQRDNPRNLQCRSSLNLPLTLRYLPDLAISLELAQDLQQAPLRRFMQVLRHVFVDDLDDLDRRPRGGGAIAVWSPRGGAHCRRRRRRRPSRLQHLHDLILALLPVRDVLCDLPAAVRDDGAVTRVGPAAELTLHLVEAGEVGGQIFEDGRPVPQHIIPREHRVLFLQHQGHVIAGVTWAMERPQAGALRPKHPPVLDVDLAPFRIVLVHLRVRAEFQQVSDAADMVVVPMSQDGFVYGRSLRREDLLQQSRPRRFALAGVDE